MDDDLVVVYCLRQTTDRGVIQFRCDVGDCIPLLVFRRSMGITVGPVDAQVNHHIEVERSWVSRGAWAQKTPDGRIAGDNLVIVLGRGRQVSQDDRVRIRPRGLVCRGLNGAGLGIEIIGRGTISYTALVERDISVPSHRDRCDQV